MSHRELQACLARLYVDDAFLRLYEVQPETIFSQYTLTQEERDTISAIEYQSLRIFASSLRGKKKNYMLKAYPALFAVNDRVITNFYCRFYDLRRIAPNDDSLDLVLRFGVFMEESLLGHEDLPSYTSDLARYERLKIWAIRNPDGQSPETRSGPVDEIGKEERAPFTLETVPWIPDDIRVGEFNNEIISIYKNLRRGEEVENPDPTPCSLVFKRPRGGQEKKIFKISSDTHRLLEFCDHRGTIGEIVEHYSRKTGDDLSEPILGAFAHLRKLGVVEG